jgi:hypothetical protein
MSTRPYRRLETYSIASRPIPVTSIRRGWESGNVGVGVELCIYVNVSTIVRNHYCVVGV